MQHVPWRMQRGGCIKSPRLMGFFTPQTLKSALCSKLWFTEKIAKVKISFPETARIGQRVTTVSLILASPMYDKYLCLHLPCEEEEISPNCDSKKNPKTKHPNHICPFINSFVHLYLLDSNCLSIYTPTYLGICLFIYWVLVFGLVFSFGFWGLGLFGLFCFWVFLSLV